MIVANDATRAGAGFGSDDNAAVILSRTGRQQEFGLMPKRRLADEILTSVQNFRIEQRHAVTAVE
jgi:phosphopantothenoylcysteine decarboxylase/phosphopantothenate--cysteine ligase